jgi:hypothetical protein
MMSGMMSERQKAGLIRLLKTNPSLFVERLFKTEHRTPLVLTSYQNKQLASLLTTLLRDKPGKFVFRQSRRSGKSELISVFISIALLVRPVKIANISYTSDQASIIFERVKSHLVLDNDWTRQFVNIGQSMINKREFSRSRFFMLNGAQFRTFSTGKGETEFTGESLLGFGADIVVIDEAASIPDAVFRTRILPIIADARSPKFLLLSGTPHRKGFMQKAEQSGEYTCFHVGWQEAVDAGQLNLSEVDSAKSDLSATEFRVWWDADWPDDDDDQLIRSSWVSGAQRDFEPKGAFTKRVLGVDVARHGKDLTVLTIVDWYDSLAFIRVIVSLSGRDTMETVGEIRRLSDAYPGITAIVVDDDGVGGGVVDRLKELPDFRGRVFPFLNGSSPHRKEEKSRDLNSSELLDNSRFLNKRAFYFSRLSRLFEKGCVVMPKNKALIEQLLSLRVRLDSDKKVRVLDDKDTGKSPDFADSLMMACSDLGATRLYWSFA